MCLPSPQTLLFVLLPVAWQTLLLANPVLSPKHLSIVVAASTQRMEKLPVQFIFPTAVTAVWYNSRQLYKEKKSYGSSF